MFFCFSFLQGNNWKKKKRNAQWKSPFFSEHIDRCFFLVLLSDSGFIHSAKKQYGNYRSAKAPRTKQFVGFCFHSFFGCWLVAAQRLTLPNELQQIDNWNFPFALQMAYSRTLRSSSKAIQGTWWIDQRRWLQQWCGHPQSRWIYRSIDARQFRQLRFAGPTANAN